MNYYIHQSSIIDENTSIGEGTKIWHFVHIMPNVQIGTNCIIGQNVFIGEGVSIGNGVKIQNNVSVYSGVTIEDDVFIGPSVVFTNVLHPRAFIDQKEHFHKTLVRKGATIGANATILCGNILGEYCLIGAGSVLTKSTEDYSLWVGNPAKNIGMVDKSAKRITNK